MQLDRITELVESGKDEGAEIYQPPCRLPEKGYWFAPTVFTNVAQSYRIAQEEIFGPVLSVLTFRTPEEAVEKANNTPYGLSAGVWTEKGSRILWMADQLQGRRRLGEHVQPLRPGVAVRRLQGVRLRPRGRPPRARAVSELRGRGVRRFRLPLLLVGGAIALLLGDHRFGSVAVSRLPVKKTYKLFIGGAFPRSESGRTYEAEGQNVARASRKDARDAVVAARKAVPGWAGATAYNRGQVLYRLAEMMETRAADLAAVCSGKKEVEAAIDRVVWYAGWADKLAQVIGSSNPGLRPVLQLLDPGADRRRRRAGAGGACARRPRLAASHR